MRNLLFFSPGMPVNSSLLKTGILKKPIEREPVMFNPQIPHPYTMNMNAPGPGQERAERYLALVHGSVRRT